MRDTAYNKLFKLKFYSDTKKAKSIYVYCTFKYYEYSNTNFS